jgi:MFS family permease
MARRGRLGGGVLACAVARVMSGILQGSWSLGFLLSSLVYGLFYPYLGWRGMLWIGILPAFAGIFVRYFVQGGRGRTKLDTRWLPDRPVGTHK